LAPKKAILIEGPPVVGWLRVDPLSGQTLGIGESGAGSALKEDYIILFL
jgi:hypothetical protein